VSDKQEDGFNYFNEKPRFVCEKFARSRYWQEKESHRILARKRKSWNQINHYC